jgi:hypothetical protein
VRGMRGVAMVTDNDDDDDDDDNDDDDSVSKNTAVIPLRLPNPAAVMRTDLQGLGLVERREVRAVGLLQVNLRLPLGHVQGRVLVQLAVLRRWPQQHPADTGRRPEGGGV